MMAESQSITKDITDLMGYWFRRELGGGGVQENSGGKELIPKILRQTVTLSTIINNK